MTVGSTRAEASIKADIVIVGAGLVGATLAAAIATKPDNASLSIVLIDQGAEPTPPLLDSDKPVFDPRVVALTETSIRLFKSIDVWPLVLNQRACPYQKMAVWDNDGTGQIEFDAHDLQQKSLGVIVENSILLSSVLTRLADLNNITLIRHQSVEQIKSHQPFAEQIKESHQQKHISLSDGRCILANLLVAADGGQSKVRELLHLPIRQWSYQQQSIVTIVKSEKSHQNTAWQNFLSSGPLAFLPLNHPSEQYCSIVWSADEQYAQQLMKSTDSEFKQQLAKAFQYRMGQVLSIEPRVCFPLIQRHAINYIAPQLALVGDAAHTIHPLAGQGVNLGLLDASVLAAEVTRASKRQLSLMDESILRRYQRQRKRHNLEFMLLMEGLKQLFGSRHLAVRWLRNQGMHKVNNFGPIKRWLAKQAIK